MNIKMWFFELLKGLGKKEISRLSRWEWGMILRKASNRDVSNNSKGCMTKQKLKFRDLIINEMKKTQIGSEILFETGKEPRA